MNIEEFVKKIQNEFVEDYDIGELDASTNIKDLEWWSSMHMLVIIALIDTEYDVLLTGEALKKVSTVQELFDLVKSQM